MIGDAIIKVIVWFIYITPSLCRPLTVTSLSVTSRLHKHLVADGTNYFEIDFKLVFKK